MFACKVYLKYKHCLDKFYYIETNLTVTTEDFEGIIITPHLLEQYTRLIEAIKIDIYLRIAHAEVLVNNYKTQIEGYVEL